MIVAQVNTEALSALAYTQGIRKGAPTIYGHYLAAVNVKSGTKNIWHSAGRNKAGMRCSVAKFIVDAEDV